jgi:hypothetical protein
VLIVTGKSAGVAGNRTGSAMTPPAAAPHKKSHMPAVMAVVIGALLVSLVVWAGMTFLPRTQHAQPKSPATALPSPPEPPTSVNTVAPTPPPTSAPSVAAVIPASAPASQPVKPAVVVAPPQKVFTLPPSFAAFPDTLAVSPDGAAAFISRADMVAVGDAKPQLESAQLFLLDLKAGTSFDMISLFPSMTSRYHVISAIFSPSGDKAMVRTRHFVSVDRHARLFVMNIKDKSVRPIPQPQGQNAHETLAIWAGPDAIFQVAVQPDVIGLPQVLRAPAMAPQDCTLRGVPLAADSAGKTVFTVIDPGYPASLPRTAALAVTPDGLKGRLIRCNPDGGNRQDLGRQPVGRVFLSPSGQYLADRTATIEAGKLRYSAEVMTTKGESQFVVGAEDIQPIGVTDDGRLVTRQIKTPSAVEIRDKTGKPATLAINAQDACLVGNRLYYVTAGAAPTIQSVALP